MERWLGERLSTYLDFDVPDCMIKYIVSMESIVEFDEYFESLLNKECEDHRLFLSDCKQRLFSKALPNKKLQQNKKITDSHSSVIKQNVTGGDATKKKSHSAYGNQDFQSQGAKKKSEYGSLYTYNDKVADSVLLKGRRLCNCQALQHKLVNNCLSCGRIICEQEGSGICLICGEFVCTNRQIESRKSSDKKSFDLQKGMREEHGVESLKKALEQRDRLLEYDRNSEKRTTVIDDELDYFEENSVWYSDEQRSTFAHLSQVMHERKHASRINRKTKYDFAGREIDDDFTISEEYEGEILKTVASVKTNSNNLNQLEEHNVGDLDPNFNAARPIYRSTTDEKAKNKLSTRNDGLERIYNRVQDKELMEMQDMRQCLSIHQPWASLMVAGIKKHEGRSWYSEHRGRLWIASTANDSKSEMIQELENFYKKLYKDPSIKFPEHYPTGCLLGSVKVDDCLSQEEYREIYTEGESDSPYILVCSNAEQLAVVFPIRGQRKIYQIDPKIHNAACKTLIRTNAIKRNK